MADDLAWRGPARALMGAVAFGVTILILSVLYYGQTFLIPIAIAVVIWYLINALATAVSRVPLLGRLPRWTFTGLSLLIILGLMTLVGRIIADNVASMIEAYPTYRDNLRDLARAAELRWNIADGTIERVVDDAWEQLDLRAYATSIASGLSSTLGTMGLVLLYVAFMLVEQTRFDSKLSELVRDPEKLTALRITLKRMQRQIETYVWVKTFTSLLTALGTWLVLIFVGVDYAIFFALITFLLNFIPTIGSTLSVIFPALMTLVQFDSFTPFLITVPSLTFVQASIGNFLEPPMMGESLNISPFIVIVSLILWGTVWGVAGMFLCVPIMVILMIILAQFPATRGAAVLLSATGRV